MILKKRHLFSLFTKGVPGIPYKSLKCLIVFGIHLFTLGLRYEKEGQKKWVTTIIKYLLIHADVGYVVQFVGALLVVNPIAYAAVVESIFIIPMILGEVVYALSLIFDDKKVAD